MLTLIPWEKKYKIRHWVLPLRMWQVFCFGGGAVLDFFFQLFIYWQAESLVAAGGIFLVMAYKLLVVVYGI